MLRSATRLTPEEAKDMARVNQIMEVWKLFDRYGLADETTYPTANPDTRKILVANLWKATCRMVNGGDFNLNQIRLISDLLEAALDSGIF